MSHLFICQKVSAHRGIDKVPEADVSAGMWISILSSRIGLGF
jgi:hypothetical protein